nr:FliM/FliN family flagellar motor switch protein [Pseudomonas carnis]
MPEGFSAQDVFQLFSAVKRPLEIASDLLDYHHLFDFEQVQGESRPLVSLPRIATAQSDLWVMCLPSQRKETPRPLQPWLLELSQTLRVVLGTCDLKEVGCSQLMRGDVLFIREQSRHLFMADQCIGQFTFIEEGLHMEFTPTHNTAPTEPNVLSQLPVKLEFVLGELNLSMAQLNDFIEQQVLPLDVIDTNHVEVRAGGQRIAIGELVQLDGCLGVELHEIFRGVTHE